MNLFERHNVDECNFVTTKRFLEVANIWRLQNVGDINVTDVGDNIEMLETPSFQWKRHQNEENVTENMIMPPKA